MPFDFDMDSMSPVNTGGGGSSVNVSPLNITPSIYAQNFVPAAGNAYAPVNVSGVNASIDSNITASNIVNGVNILGVTGTAQTGDFVGIPRQVINGVFSMPTEPYTFSLPSNATDIGNSALNRAFTFDSYITGANLSSLTQISGESAIRNAFSYCPNFTTVDLSNVKNISGNNALAGAFRGCNSLTAVALSNVTNISGQRALESLVENSSSIETVYLNSLTSVGSYSLNSAFSNSGIQYLDFPSMTSITNYSCVNMCRNCHNLMTVNFPSLVNATGDQNSFDSAFKDSGVVSVNFGSLVDCNTSGNIFSSAWQNCPNLTSVNLSSLVAANYRQVFMNAFRDCPSLTTMNFNSLNVVGAPNAFGNAFTNDSAIEHIYFNAFTNGTIATGQASIFTNMLYNTGTSVTHTVHFPNNIENAVMNTTGYPLFGGTSSYVTLAFDLPSTD